MRPAVVVLACCLSLVGLAGCQTRKPVAPEPVVYRYTGFNQQEAAVVSGTLRLVRAGDAVEGTWELEAGEGVRFADIGPQAGDGQLTGHVDRRGLILNLQPGSLDNKVVLYARQHDRKLSGRWQYVGFGGILAEGTFVALQQ